MKKTFKSYIKKWHIVVLIIFVLIVVGYVFLKGGDRPIFETALVTTGDIIREVSVTGKVSPIERAQLSFAKGGIVTKIAVKVGDKVKRGDMIASLDDAVDKANLAAAEAKLADISRTLRPEEWKLEQSKVNSSKVALDNSKKDSENAFRESYNTVQSALINYTDQIFDNPQSINPTIKVRLSGTTQQSRINELRLKVTENMAKWKADIDAMTSGVDQDNLLSKAMQYLDVDKIFLSELSAIVNGLNSVNSGLTEATLEIYISDTNTAISLQNQAITVVTTADSALRNASSAYVEAQNSSSLKVAGSSSESIKAQAASVAAYRAELSRNQITASIDGIITRVVPNVGEYVSPGMTLFDLQSSGIYKIEANVAEADIAKIAIDDTAQVTLDAYGQDVIFGAKLVRIDPAETVLEGVPTYKVTLFFDDEDEKIFSGMTANTDILTDKRNDVMMVPSRSILEEKDEITGQVTGRFVRVMNPDNRDFTKVPVTVGLKGSSGTTEIISGLNIGDTVVTYVK
ncbi:MAG: efflux RND transporter periplasmic adaptor subunit [Candidatus Paceibacterota bacterium]|jgi:HlyD family secretion protein